MVIEASRRVCFLVALLSAVDLGISLRFWRAVFTLPPPLTIDWSPAIYWLVGIMLAGGAVQATRSARGRIPHAIWTGLLILNGLCFSGYLSIAGFLLWRSFSRQ